MIKTNPIVKALSKNHQSKPSYYRTIYKRLLMLFGLSVLLTAMAPATWAADPAPAAGEAATPAATPPPAPAPVADSVGYSPSLNSGAAADLQWPVPADPKKISNDELINNVAHNKIAINVVW